MVDTKKVEEIFADPEFRARWLRAMSAGMSRMLETREGVVVHYSDEGMEVQDVSDRPEGPARS
jgi:hypothetical protein